MSVWHLPGRSALAAMVLVGGMAAEAGALGDDAALRAQRDAAAEEMLADPTNGAAMLRHARLSIRLREFEPAVSTLERYLDQNPRDYGARLDLAISYFALGGYSVAKRHFQRLQAAGGSAKDRRLIQQYLDAIDVRTATHGFDGSVAAGIAMSTNAALLSDNGTVFNFGVPLTRAAGTGPDGDVGATFSARVQHRYDLGTAFGDYWFTEGGVEMLHFLNERNGDFDGFFLRSGPILSLNEYAYGAKLRPFVEADTVFAGAEWLYTTTSAGVQVNYTFTADWSVHGTLRSGYRWHEARNGDGAIQRATAGVTHWASRDLRIRLTGLATWDMSESDAIANIEFGGRLGLLWDFDPQVSFAERKWRFEAYGQVLSRQFTDPDATVDPTRERDDIDLRLGAKLTAHLVDGFFVTTGIDYLDRSSNIAQFEGEELLFTAAFGYDF